MKQGCFCFFFQLQSILNFCDFSFIVNQTTKIDTIAKSQWMDRFSLFYSILRVEVFFFNFQHFCSQVNLERTNFWVAPHALININLRAVANYIAIFILPIIFRIQCFQCFKIFRWYTSLYELSTATKNETFNSNCVNCWNI